MSTAMTIDAYRKEIKLLLAGNGEIELDINDATLDEAITSALQDLQPFIDTPNFITIDYKRAIDLSDYNVSSVSRVYRSQGFMSSNYAQEETSRTSSYYIDPIYGSMWGSLYGYGNIYNTTNWVYNLAAWNTTMQIANTLSTDLQFLFDKNSDTLYINTLINYPATITIEYIPIYNSVDQIQSTFWQGKLRKLALAKVKMIIGRIRSKYSLENSLWKLDTNILQEGQTEYKEVMEDLVKNTQLTYGVD